MHGVQEVVSSNLAGPTTPCFSEEKVHGGIPKHRQSSCRHGLKPHTGGLLRHAGNGLLSVAVSPRGEGKVVGALPPTPSRRADRWQALTDCPCTRGSMAAKAASAAIPGSATDHRQFQLHLAQAGQQQAQACPRARCFRPSATPPAFASPRLLAPPPCPVAAPPQPCRLSSAISLTAGSHAPLTSSA